MARGARRVHMTPMPSSTTSPVYMDAVLTPNRSLSRQGLYILLAVLAAYNLLVMVFLLVIGAFPVPIFLGLDFIGVLIAFRVSNRRAGWAERVRVTAERVQVTLRRSEGAEQTVWSSPTAFTRVALEQAGEHESRLRLRLSGRTHSVGASLSPTERLSFAEALERAIRSARAERYAP